MATKAKKQQTEARTDILMLAYLCVKDQPNLEKQVAILDRFGLPDAEIALVCGKAEGSVRNTRLDKKPKPKKAKASKDGAPAAADVLMPEVAA